MRQGGSRRRGLVEREPVLLVGENVLDRAIAVGAEPLGARTGGVEPVQPVDPAQPHEPETRAIALLGMRAAFEDAGDEPPRGRAGLVGPPDQAGRVHSAWARWARGMCATWVEKRPRPVSRACDATRRPLKKTSTVVCVTRASTWACTS